MISRALGLMAGLLLIASPSFPQSLASGSAPTAAADFIIDNSFLVEEAVNQDPGVIQTTLNWVRSGDGDWESAVGQDWPLASHRHQFSWSLPWNGGQLPLSVGQAVVSYRYQISDVSKETLGIGARVSAILPTDRDGEEHGVGLQAAVPVTAEWRRLHLHANAGVTWTRQRSSEHPQRTSLVSPYFAGSVIWPTASMFQVMLEDVVEFEAFLDAGARRRRNTTMTISPGLRGAFNVGRNQIVVGAAVPVDATTDGQSVSVLGYFSFEGPFRRSR